ncbi:MAG: hypothetical protein GWN87_18795 [Desulfuromonadales bacterium]|nr:hypothetical protein [Desulfuromonadales bacterium]
MPKPPLPKLFVTGTGVTTSVEAQIDLRCVVWSAMREDMDGILLDLFADLFWKRWPTDKPGRALDLNKELDELAENLKPETLDLFEVILTAAGRLGESSE